MRLARGVALLVAVTATLLAVGGCGAGEADDSDAAGAAAEQREGASGMDAGTQGGGPAEDGRGADPGGAGGQLPPGDRAVIYTGQLTIRVDEVERAADRAADVASRYGGYVGADRREAHEEHASAELVLRVPSQDFPAAVDALGELGQEVSREIGTEDVTEEVVDLETRLATAQASVDRTRALLEEAESLGDVVQIEGELAQREAQLASLQARQRELTELVDLSTITVALVGPEATDPSAEPERGFVAGLRAGWDAFVGTLTVGSTVVGALLPFALAAVPPLGAVWWLRHRRRLTRTETAAAD